MSPVSANREAAIYLVTLMKRLYSQKVSVEDAVQEMLGFLGGRTIKLPKKTQYPKSPRIRKAILAGATNEEIALRYGVCLRHILRLRQQLRKQGEQR